MAEATGEPPGGPDQPDIPEDIDKRLRDIEAELRQPAKFKEPSAAERTNCSSIPSCLRASAQIPNCESEL